MVINTRSLQIEDCPNLIDLMDQLGHSARPEELAQRFQMLAHSSDDFFWVAEDSSKKLVGFIHLKVAITIHYYPSVEVCALVVNSSSRGLGIGKVLMAKGESWAQEKGYSIIWLRSNVKRDDAHKFYSSLGYETIASSHFFQKTLL